MLLCVGSGPIQESVIRSATNDRTAYNCKMCDIMISSCCQVCRDLRETTVVAVSKGRHDVGLRKQYLDIATAGIVGISYCLYGFGYCTVLMLAVRTDGRWELAATHCNTIRFHHCDMILQTDPRRSTSCRMPTRNTTNIRVTVQNKCLHCLTLHWKLQQSEGQCSVKLTSASRDKPLSPFPTTCCCRTLVLRKMRQGDHH